ncbi:MAG: hypothetical protein M0R21_08150 [Lentimicrobiaceae bacterium]|nr:hypothetical protein [Lentimicrobiaceae bacterium]
MKTKLFCIITMVILPGFFPVFGQGFQPPANGKAVIYFVSLKKKSCTFDYFHQDKYIGFFGKNNYMRYECDPGKQLFWASSETKDFVTADLKAGDTYIVTVDMVIGFWRNNPKLTAISAKHELFAKAAALIKSKKPVVTPDAKIEARNQELKVEFIPNILSIYENDWKNSRTYTHISQDMSIPADAMK